MALRLADVVWLTEVYAAGEAPIAAADGLGQGAAARFLVPHRSLGVEALFGHQLCAWTSKCSCGCAQAGQALGASPPSWM